MFDELDAADAAIFAARTQPRSSSSSSSSSGAGYGLGGRGGGGAEAGGGAVDGESDWLALDSWRWRCAFLASSVAFALLLGPSLCFEATYTPSVVKAQRGLTSVDVNTAASLRPLFCGIAIALSLPLTLRGTLSPRATYTLALFLFVAARIAAAFALASPAPAAYVLAAGPVYGIALGAALVSALQLSASWFLDMPATTTALLLVSAAVGAGLSRLLTPFMATALGAPLASAAHACLAALFAFPLRFFYLLPSPLLTEAIKLHMRTNSIFSEAFASLRGGVGAGGVSGATGDGNDPMPNSPGRGYGDADGDGLHHNGGVDSAADGIDGHVHADDEDGPAPARRRFPLSFARLNAFRKRLQGRFSTRIRRGYGEFATEEEVCSHNNVSTIKLD